MNAENDLLLDWHNGVEPRITDVARVQTLDRALYARLAEWRRRHTEDAT